MQQALADLSTNPTWLIVGAVLLVAVLGTIGVLYLFAHAEEEDYEEIAAGVEASKKSSVYYWSIDSETQA